MVFLNLCLELLLLTLSSAEVGDMGINWAPSIWEPSVALDTDQLHCLKTYPTGPDKGNCGTNHTFMILQGLHQRSVSQSAVINQTVSNAKQVGFLHFNVYMTPSPNCNISATKQIENMGEPRSYLICTCSQFTWIASGLADSKASTMLHHHSSRWVQFTHNCML